jgi:hypothetical protein
MQCPEERGKAVNMPHGRYDAASSDCSNLKSNPRYQVVFLVFGPISIAWGVFLFFFLPTSPMTAWFLTERERKISVMRVCPLLGYMIDILKKSLRLLKITRVLKIANTNFTRLRRLSLIYKSGCFALRAFYNVFPEEG